MKISFLGDISLNDAYIKAAQEDKDLFSQVGSFLKNNDEVIANLECTVESEDGENELKKHRIKTSLRALEYIKDIGVTVALMANNHIYDNFDDGFFKTTQFLKNNNIEFTGAGTKETDFAKPILIQKGAVSVCILNYVHKNTNPKPYDGTQIQLNYFEVDKVRSDIKKYKHSVDHIIIVPHWGGDYECASYPNPIQSCQAKIFINDGASAVIGHHSHTLQPYEYYKGKPIFHSLGNFCFADIEKFGHEVDHKLGKESVIVTLLLTKEHVKTEITPVKNINLKVELDKSGKVLNRLNKRNKTYLKLVNNNKAFKLYTYKHRYFDTFYFFFFGNKRNFFNRLKHINLSRIKYFLLRK